MAGGNGDNSPTKAEKGDATGCRCRIAGGAAGSSPDDAAKSSLASNGMGVASAVRASSCSSKGANDGPMGENSSARAAFNVPPGVSQLPYAAIPGVPTP